MVFVTPRVGTTDGFLIFSMSLNRIQVSRNRVRIKVDAANEISVHRNEVDDAIEYDRSEASTEEASTEEASINGVH